MEYDVIVVGAGHAGVEACLATARMGLKTLLVTLNQERIASMPCNPSVGGPAKGIVVREIDALGGEMGRAADRTALQMKLLNSSRGPAVWALRAQSDKVAYSQYMRDVIAKEENLDVLEGMVEQVLVRNHTCYGVQVNGQAILAKAVILTTGTYMEAEILQGMEKYSSGPDGEQPSRGLSTQLQSLGLELIRLKTGTPPRILKDSIDFSKAQPEPGTDLPLAFSYSTKKFTPLAEQEMCWLVHSTSETQKIVEDNLCRSAMYSGNVKGTGPRYCPSFEDKIVRFSDKPRHQIFLEPESKSLNTIYIQGFSTSMPKDVQEAMVRSLPGLEKAVFVKYAYAIEYDAIVSTQLKHTLETKIISNLYTAGQINGTSGYEEAACQGLMAGINAALKIRGAQPLVLRRDEAYIGLLIDDLVIKGTNEPYRLLTSRAEFRLLLRNDNVEKRLKHYARDLGLVSPQEWAEFETELAKEESMIVFLKATRITPKSPLAIKLAEDGVCEIREGVSLYSLLKRPEIDVKYLEEFYPNFSELSLNSRQNIVINIRFEGYLAKEREAAQKANKMESKLIPADLDYNQVDNLALEAREKFMKIHPETIGQASRISGITPADIQMLLFYLKKHNYI